jgi:hypothetical protein
MKRKKFKKITDEMIGHADRVCSCSETVGEMIISAEDKKASLKETLESLALSKKDQKKKTT